jgi:hypothetical protein
MARDKRQSILPWLDAHLRSPKITLLVLLSLGNTPDATAIASMVRRHEPKWSTRDDFLRIIGVSIYLDVLEPGLVAQVFVLVEDWPPLVVIGRS